MRRKHYNIVFAKCYALGETDEFVTAKYSQKRFAFMRNRRSLLDHKLEYFAEGERNVFAKCYALGETGAACPITNSMISLKKIPLVLLAQAGFFHWFFHR